MKKLAALFDLFRKGKAVANPSVYGDAGALGGAVFAFLAALLACASLFGHPIPIDPDTLHTLAYGIGSVAYAVLVLLHIVSNKDVGLPPAPQPDAVPDADGSGDTGISPSTPG